MDNQAIVGISNNQLKLLSVFLNIFNNFQSFVDVFWSTFLVDNQGPLL